MVQRTEDSRKRGAARGVLGRRRVGDGPRLIVLPFSAWLHDKVVRGSTRLGDVLMWSLSQYPGAHRWEPKS